MNIRLPVPKVPWLFHHSECPLKHCEHLLYFLFWMHTNLIAPLSCCRESVKYTCICKMSVVSTYRKKKRKEKTSESIISHANDWYMATISRATGISPILQRINQHFQKLLLLHVKRLAVLSLHFKLHLIKKKWDIKSFFP